jgi:glucosamine--fructose-6-phosphate aminotransferase (isomerizing)
MDNYENVTPLLAADSPLDKRSKEIIRELYVKEEKKVLALPTDDPLDEKRRKRVDYTRTEMWEQPDVIRRNLKENQRIIAQAAAYYSKKPLEKIFLVGCGDSLAAMIAVRALFESLLEIPCEPVQALEFTYYYSRIVNDRTLVITLSSSGVTTRTVEAMLLARELGAMTLALSNTVGSTLMVESTYGILIDAQRKGWPTQSSTAAMALLVQFALELAALKGANRNRLEATQVALEAAPGQVETVLEETNELIQKIAEKEAERSFYLFCGGGPAYASAVIGAAKVMECTPDYALGIELEEYHHYNNQKIGDPLFLVVPDGPSIPRAVDTARSGRRLGGQVYTVTSTNVHELNNESDIVFHLPQTAEFISPLIYTVPLQMFAYHLAMVKFRLAEARLHNKLNSGTKP